MTTALDRLAATGVLAPLDVQFARVLADLAPDEPEPVIVAAALTSRAVRNGHVCLDLARTLALPPVDADGRPTALPLPGRDAWALQLSTSRVVGMGDRPTPLVFDGGARLYLMRYFRYQERLAADLRARVAMRPGDVDGTRLPEALDRLMPLSGAGFVADPQQRLAALVAAVRGLTVITGGPGTGKTTTVLRILAILQEQALARGRPLSIRLLAPTGKAAARLVESIAAGREALPCSEAVKTAIPTVASTIHRALGYRPGSPTRFRHDEHDPLPADLVLVDEASMVDLALMSKLLRAVPARARVILLGDKDQLASVEAGAILGDICDAGTAHGWSRAFCREIAEAVGPDHAPEPTGGDAPGIGDCIVELARSFRFDHGGGIGELARAIGRGDAAAVIAALGDPVAPREVGDREVALVSLPDDGDPGAQLGSMAVAGLSPLFATRDPAQRLAALSAFRVLCAHRRGPAGVERIGPVVEQLLQRAGLLRAGVREEFYDGRPILVTQNDHQLGLYNGDAGVVMREPGAPARVAFAGPAGIRMLSAYRLPPHETVLAMTVHKSQGSELDRVALVVPPATSPILTRELIYTAVTRARRQVVVHGDARVLAEAVGRRIDRASGLREALWGGT